MRGATRALPAQIAATVASHALWSPGMTVAVAVSGGADSVALLHALHRGRAQHGGSLRVVTVDHGAREGSAEDARFVWALAERLGLSCERVALGCRATDEASLREARFRAFDAVASERIALGHHADDQAETVLLRLARGTGPTGLAGMAWRRDRFVRPLLDRRRDALREWLVAINEPWREDPSNADPRYTRNQLRAHVLPALEACRPGATSALARSAASNAEDDALLREIAAGLAGPPFSISALQAAPWPVARRALQRIPSVQHGHIDALRQLIAKGFGVVQLSDGRIARGDGDEIRVMPGQPVVTAPAPNHDEPCWSGR